MLMPARRGVLTNMRTAGASNLADSIQDPSADRRNDATVLSVIKNSSNALRSLALTVEFWHKYHTKNVAEMSDGELLKVGGSDYQIAVLRFALCDLVGHAYAFCPRP